jgi:hypothetical protein
MKKTKIKAAPETTGIELLVYMPQKLPRTYKNVEGFGVSDGVLYIHTHDGAEKVLFCYTLHSIEGYSATGLPKTVDD